MRIQPIAILSCPACGENWNEHLRVAQSTKITRKHCILVLKNKNRGPVGPVGPMGATGVPGPPGPMGGYRR